MQMRKITLEEIKKWDELGKIIHERVHAILEFHPDRFLEDEFVWAGHNKERGTKVYVPPCEVESWNIYLKDEHQEKDEVHVTWGPPSRGYTGETYSTFPLEWITNDKLFQKKIAEFKKKHDEMQLRVDREHKKLKKKREYEKKLEKELEEERDKKIEEFEKKLEDENV